MNLLKRRADEIAIRKYLNKNKHTKYDYFGYNMIHLSFDSKPGFRKEGYEMPEEYSYGSSVGLADAICGIFVPSSLTVLKHCVVRLNDSAKIRENEDNFKAKCYRLAGDKKEQWEPTINKL